MDQETIFSRLDQLGIHYQTYHHEPLFTVDQATTAVLPGPVCKNLFLKDSKKKLWLVVAVGDTKISLKELGKMLGAKELRFAGHDLLMEFLGVEPGSVTPFGLINDKEHRLTVILDTALFDHEVVGFHPLKNDATTVIHPDDLKKFVESCGNAYMEVDFTSLVHA